MVKMMPENLAKRLVDLGMDPRMIALKTGASIRTIERWLKGKQPQPIFKERLFKEIEIKERARQRKEERKKLKDAERSEDIPG